MPRQAPHSGRANPLSVPVPQPMLARPSKTLPAGDDWVFEVKWDGIRIVARVAGGGARLWSRGGIDVTERHAEIATALAERARRPRRGDRRRAVCARLCRTAELLAVPAGGGSRVLYAFDLLELDGESLCDRPLDERRSALDELLPPTVTRCASRACSTMGRACSASRGSTASRGWSRSAGRARTRPASARAPG